MAKSEYTDLTYFMIYGYKLVKNLERKPPWHTKGGREMLEKQSPKNILLMLMYQIPRP